jgi:hypothetical protein
VSDAQRARGVVVGLNPWLPWPLSGWGWWTAPVRAERLAVLRIGLASLLLLDILISYLPHLHDFFGPDSLGTPEMFDYLARAPKWNWSLLRGFQDPLLTTAAQVVWLVTTPVILLGLWGRLSAGGPPGPHPVLRWSLAAWTVAGAFAVLALWTRVTLGPEHGASLLWRIPLAILGVATFFWCLALWRRLREEPDDDPWLWRWVLLAWAVSALLAAVGFWKVRAWPERLPFLAWSEGRWHGEVTALRVAMVAWAVSVVLLLLGLWTRASAAAAWVLSLSFDNLNWYVNNAGDQVRGITLFYLMLTPCGAAWSLDSWLARLRGRRAGPVYVYPWALRLLFVQMVYIYFVNGVYKAFSADWIGGGSLYHVWCDLTLTRFSYAQFPVPYVLTQLMSWTVLAWELSFPLLVLVRWTRPVALLFGVAFHLGIFATLELGGFGPYMLVLYLPLLPWDRWLEKRAARGLASATSRGQVTTSPAPHAVAAEGDIR